jgi:hypothetical protein
VITVQSSLVADCSVAVLRGTAGVGLETASQFAEQDARACCSGAMHPDSSPVNERGIAYSIGFLGVHR